MFPNVVMNVADRIVVLDSGVDHRDAERLGHNNRTTALIERLSRT